MKRVQGEAGKREFCTVELSVDMGNERALQFYRSQGFVKKDKKENWILLECILKNGGDEGK